MPFFGPELFMMLILLVGQTGGDLLDLVSTDAYWRSKNVTVSVEQLRRDAGPDAPIADVDQLVKDLSSEEFPIRKKARQKLLDMGPAVIDKLKPVTSSTDNEVAATAQQIIQQLSTHAQARSIRRLMAIRTLGERKEKDAVDLLNSLTNSKEPFVADYARRALAQIAGKPIFPTFDEKAYAADLQSLPKASSLVVQFRTSDTGKHITIDSLVDDVVKAAKDQQDSAPEVPGAPQRKLPDRQKLIDRATTQMLKALEAVGNIRIDSATVGADIDIENDKGFAAMVFHGQYNPQAVLDFIRASSGDNPNERLKISKVDNIDYVEFAQEGCIALVSPNRLVLATGPRSDHHAALVGEILKRLAPDAAPKPGDGGLTENDQLAPLLKSVNKKADAWACGIVPKPARNEKPFAAFDTFIAQAIRDKDAIHYSVTGTGDDVEKVKGSAEAITDSLKEALDSIKQEAVRRRSLAPVVTMFESMKCVAEGKSATLSGIFTSDIFTSMLQETGAMFLGGMDDDATPPGMP